MIRYVFTYILIVINIVIFLLIRQHKIDSDDLAVSYHLVFNRKQYQRIITSAFAHEDPIHIFFNMVSLYNVGTFVESFFGHRIFLLIYFGSMIFGKILALQIRHGNHDDYTMSIGASGAISGLLGAYFMAIIYFNGMSGLPYLIRPVISLLMISFMPGVDGTSHFSCMAVGMAITYIVLMI